MSASLFREIVKFLSGLEPIQLELEQLYERRLSALAAVQPALLLKLVEEEQAIQQRLRQQLQQRAVILGNARSERLASTNLANCCTTCLASSSLAETSMRGRTSRPLNG